jgi:hypothetical protein
MHAGIKLYFDFLSPKNGMQGKNGAVKLMLCLINWSDPNSTKGEKNLELGTDRRT